MLITNGELNSECDEFKNVSTTGIPYSIRFYQSSSVSSFTTWNDNTNNPLNGYISMWYESGTSPGFETDFEADPGGEVIM